MIKAILLVPLAAAFTADDANKAFLTGAYSNDLSQAGLLMHQFDYEFPMTRWQPCTIGGGGWCPYDDRVSCLLVNQKISVQQGKVNVWTAPAGSSRIGDQPGGVILNPKVIRETCSYSADGGSYDRLDHGCGCHKNAGPACVNNSCESELRNPQLQCAYGNNNTADMMKDMVAQGNKFNEVIVDSVSWVDGLPGTILAFWYPTNSTGCDEGCQEVVQNAHGGFLAKYPTVKDVPLLELNVNGGADPKGPFKLPAADKFKKSKSPAITCRSASGGPQGPCPAGTDSCCDGPPGVGQSCYDSTQQDCCTDGPGKGHVCAKGMCSTRAGFICN